MPTYDAEVDPADENNSHALMLRLIGPDRRVLDVGCATGYLGEALIERGCRVSGVELDPEAAARAADVLEEVFVTDLETADLVAHFGPGSFDVVVLGDVLEHLRDPARLLRNAVGLLADRGSVVISVPNMTHSSVRLSLLQGRFRYSDRGLLDRTHVHFFTRGTLLELVRDAGLAAVEVVPTTAGTFATEIPVDAARLPAGVVEWVESQPDADTYQFVLRAVRDDAEGAVAVLRTRMEAAQAAAAAAAERLREAEAELARVRSSAGQAGERAERAERDLQALSSTRTLRALAGPRRAYGQARRLLGR